MAAVRKRQWTTKSGERRTAFFVDFYEANGKRDRRLFTTKREADAFRVEIEGQLHAGTFRADAAKITLKEVADLFLKHCAARRERHEKMTQHNYKIYEGHIRNYICPDAARHANKAKPARLRSFDKGIGGFKLRELTGRRVGDFVDELRNAGLSVPTTRKVLGTLKVMLAYAISRDLIVFNVARTVKVLGRQDERSKQVVPPTKDSLMQLVEAADANFRIYLIVASATGMRAGEFHALRWKHVHLEKREVKIETRVDAYGDEDVTKTAAGHRVVPLGGQVVAALKAWKLRSSYKKAADLVFPNADGGYENHDNMVKRRFNPLFETLAKRHAELPLRNSEPVARFNWHALRHFAISCWIEAGLDPKTVQTFAGHSSLQVTMDRYGHLFKSEDHQRAMDSIAAQLYG